MVDDQSHFARNTIIIAIIGVIITFCAWQFPSFHIIEIITKHPVESPTNIPTITTTPPTTIQTMKTTIPQTTISMSNHVPKIQGLSSDKGGGQIIGTDITWTVSATDADNDVIDYQFLLEGPGYNPAKIQKDWSPENTWTWSTSGRMDGNYTVTCYIRDDNDQSNTNNNIFKKSPEIRLIKVDGSLTDIENLVKEGWIFINNKNDDPEAALICFNQSVNQVGDTSQISYAWSGRGFAWMRLGKKDEAVDSFTQSLNIYPNNLDALVGIAEAYNDLGKYELAQGYLNRAFPLAINLTDKTDQKDGICYSCQQENRTYQGLSNSGKSNDMANKYNNICNQIGISLSS